jgi:hypothetical protein
LEGDYLGRWQIQLAGVSSIAVYSPLDPIGHPLGVIIPAPAGSRQVECELPANGTARRPSPIEAN